MIISTFIQNNVNLHDKNWFKTGGNARYYAEPNSSGQFIESLRFAQKNLVPIFVLGEGANILISDDGFDGLIIRPTLNQITIINQNADSAFVQAGAGTSVHHLIEFCLDNQLIGLEEFAGIPGTVGGAVYINLHYFEFLLSQFLVSATVIEKKTGILLTVDNAWFNFGYNQSTLLQEQYYLIDATFKVKRATEIEAAYARGRRQEIIRHRQRRYPNFGTCGSFFRNFHSDEVMHENNGQKLIWVAYYLDKIGVKGSLSVGQASVSHQHANMIVNKGTATSTDIITLARLMQEKVYNQFGIIPQPECRLIGFKEYPLL